MSVKRINPGPRMSSAVVHGDTVYLAGLTADDPKADVKGQTAQILAKIDKFLKEAGTDKSKILSANIWLTDIKTWSQVGVTGEWANKPISMYGRNSASGTYGYFKEVVMENGDFKDSVKEQAGSSAVVQAIASDKFAIGYSGVGYKTADVKAIEIKAKDNGTCYDGSPENAYKGDYPITRFLYVYMNRKPGAPMEPLRNEFVKFIFSKQGQTGVLKDGYYPIPSAIAFQDLKATSVE